MFSIRSLFVGVAALLVALVAVPAKAQSASPMDGLWQMKATPDSTSLRKGAVAWDDQTLIENGVATAAVLSKYGFVPSTTSILATSPALKFEVTYVADKFGSLKCSATQQSSTRVTGTLTWNRADGTVWVYTFEMNKIPFPTPAE